MSKIFYRGVDIKTGEIVIGKSLINDEYGNIHIIKEISNHINWNMMHSVFPDTLAIHFPDMLDSQGNKIFASLQEDGKGGDIVIIKDTTFKYTYKYIKGRFILGECMDLLNPFLLFEQTGIQE